MEYGNKLNPEHSLRTAKGIKGTRQKVIVTHNPSEIDQNQLLLVRFPNLGSDDIIVPGMANLSFNIELTSTTDPKRTLMSNIGRAIIKKLAVKFEGNEILSIDDFNIFACYRDLWKTKLEKNNAIRHGIISNDGCTENCIKLRINAGDKSTSNKKDSAIAETYGNKFLIPLDFEMLDSSAPYYQAGLGNRLCYEITFNDYNRVIKSAVASPDAKYVISNISLEYEIVTNSTLARSIKAEYDKMILLYNRILRHRQIPVYWDTTSNWSFNTPCKSLKGTLVLFEGEQPYAQDTGKFYNPKIQKVSVIVEGKPNQLYAQGMRSFEQYDEICKYFTQGSQKDNNANEIKKKLQLHNVNVGEYLTDKDVLWLDFRTIDENSLYRTGRRIENALEGITLRIEKKAESTGAQCLHLPNHGCLVEHPVWRIHFCYILKMFMKEPHTALFVASTGVGKTHLALNLIENEYRNHFDFIVIICPTLRYNSTYRSRSWVWNDPDVIPIEPGNQLYYLIEKISNLLAGSATLFLIDDIIADETLDKRHQPLLELAISGRNRDHSLWLLTQSYTAVPNNIRRQAKMLYVWYPKNKTEFNVIHKENDVIEMGELARVKAQLKRGKQTCLIMRMEHPRACMIR